MTKGRLVRINGELYVAFPVSEEDLPRYQSEMKEILEGESVDFRIGNHERTLYKKEVIKVLKEQKGKLKNFNTAYLEWEGEKYAIKEVFNLVTGIPKDEYNTVLAESYLRKLGFITGRLR